MANSLIQDLDMYKKKYPLIPRTKIRYELEYIKKRKKVTIEQRLEKLNKKYTLERSAVLGVNIED